MDIVVLTTTMGRHACSEKGPNGQPIGEESKLNTAESSSARGGPVGSWKRVTIRACWAGVEGRFLSRVLWRVDSYRLYPYMVIYHGGGHDCVSIKGSMAGGQAAGRQSGLGHLTPM